MVSLHAKQLCIDFFHALKRLLEGCLAVGHSTPTLDIAGHLVVAAPFALHLAAQLALAGNIVAFVHELEPASLAYAVLLIALHSKLTPAPVAAPPARLIVVAHCAGALARPQLSVAGQEIDMLCYLYDRL